MSAVSDEMNTTFHSSIKEVPYEVVFGQPPQRACLPSDARGVISLDDDEESDQRFANTRTSAYVALNGEQQTSDLCPQNVAFGEYYTADNMQEPCGRDQVAATDNIETYAAGAIEEEQGEPETSAVLDDDSETTIHTEAANARSSLPSPSSWDLRPLSTRGSHQDIRDRAQNNFEKSSRRMADYYDRKKSSKRVVYKVGDLVTVSVPKADRSKGDIKRLPCIIMEISGAKQQLYRLR